MYFYARLYKTFIDYISQCWFWALIQANNYDLNMLKPLLIKAIQDRQAELGLKLVLRRGTTYLALVTHRLTFLDISNYLAPRFSYDRYLRAYGCTLRKGFFPYKCVDDLPKLYQSASVGGFSQ